MSCEHEQLLQKALDGELSIREQEAFTAHLQQCKACKAEYELVEHMIVDVKKLADISAPLGFTANVMRQLPAGHKKKSPIRWMKQHPIVAAAAIFLVLMVSSLFSSWSTGEMAIAGNTKHLQINKQQHEVIVPKGETFKGDLVVENGDVKVEGTVEGNVTIIKGKRYLASAGSITGDSQEIHDIMHWTWYKLKSLVSAD
ncbi:Anti-sigma-W factor rsiW [Fictibacillus macauensis ZFHKF-1]|uniref:Anti-sigma-W factor RsiW n=1 Tax=Fictibacillus macauensis ZFHKF-1 TaxID=1196324 RepID=I8UKF5_9BACL|nr:anti-sigma factor [Fictibacillus macauensis]EIT87360.1 Anti-sigma-W factor rsiW [Fictibacillus macauensis ZFHKF-1]